MTKDTNRKTTQLVASGFVDHEGGGANRRERASYPDPDRKPVTKEECVSVYNQETDDLLQGDRLEESGMALSVTRHVSTPYTVHTQFQFILFGHIGRELVGFGNSLPHCLPEKDKEYQHHLGVVGDGRQCAHGWGCFSLYPFSVRLVIDHSINQVYNLSHGKSDLIEGPTKEIHNGSI